jgi:hypothetical protein
LLKAQSLGSECGNVDRCRLIDALGPGTKVLNRHLPAIGACVALAAAKPVKLGMNGPSFPASISPHQDEDWNTRHDALSFLVKFFDGHCLFPFRLKFLRTWRAMRSHVLRPRASKAFQGRFGQP